jgi:hypothetical protein
MKTKFYGNTSKDERRTLRIAARYKLAERKYDLLTYMTHGVLDCDTDMFEPSEITALDEFYERNGSLDKYWVRTEIVNDGSEQGNNQDARQGGNNEPYLCLTLTDTVPIEEIRVYHDSGFDSTAKGKVEYLYLDWNKGVALTITDEEWAKWLREIVVEMGLLGEGVASEGVREREGGSLEEEGGEF